MIVVVTGAAGQLGQDVVINLEKSNHVVYGANRETLDITNEDNVKQYIANIKPDVIIHCAAYTNVDKAEEEPDVAYEINALGSKYLAEAASSVGAKMLYVSTDYVFDGSANEPYEVNHPTNPLGVYGNTKLAGEKFVAGTLEEHFIIRTAWVYGTKGNNFVKTMIRLGAERGQVGVVSDQIGSPTYTVDLANFLIELMVTDKYGIYHATNGGECSWYDFAKEIFRQADLQVIVNPLTTEQFPRPAKRPSYSVLSKQRIESEGLKPLRHWTEGLTAYFNE
ncbi:dTDP-4-dehydrorhamnose reductase [Metabacillus malikii]|uniref:dTDP-4-dehydrorhamnose reductase n=1 Tax=Metabacillus malikii TaxID=1504265 RepID=A0ABT9ZIR9_9BACI|nr:dTDP-4-dehydrorhamnose reductase [Metabacillus malikii]MDQ0231438.1 dTDP-4-dehydrorhamnose reductase [Metabacillus malikii]